MGINFGSLGATPAAPANEWTCSCGTKNTGAFCISCGQAQGAPAPTPTPAVAPAPVVTPTATPVVMPSGAVTLDLTKGSILDITKRNPGLKHIKVGCGWDVAGMGAAFDLDVSAFLLGANGKISSGSDVVFFNNMSVPGVKLSGDNRTGVGEGDDETIEIDLSAVSATVSKIVICVTICDAVARQQTFGMVSNSYVRLLDADQGDKDLCMFRLKEDGSTSTAVVFAELSRNGADWDFKAIGEGKQGDLNTLAALFS